MIRKSISIIYLIFIFFQLQAQDHSVMDIYQEAIGLIRALEEKGFEFVRTEIDVLSEGDTFEKTRRTLFPGYEYSFIVHRDQYITDIDLEVYQSIDDDWQLVGSATTLKEISTIKSLKITPKEKESYLFKVKANGFVDGSTSGRYMLTIGHLGENNSRDLTEESKESKESKEYILRGNSYLLFERKIDSKKFLTENFVKKPVVIQIDFEKGQIKFISEGKTENYYLIRKDDVEYEEKTIKFQTLNDQGIKWTVLIDLENSTISFYYINSKNVVTGKVIVYTE